MIPNDIDYFSFEDFIYSPLENLNPLDTDGIQPRAATSLITVMIIYLPNNDKELIPNIPAAKYSANGDLDLAYLVDYLKQEGIPIEDQNLIYYANKTGAYVYSGKDPLPQDAKVPAACIEKTQTGNSHLVTLKIRSKVECVISKSDNTHNAQSKTIKSNDFQQEDKEIAHNSKKKNRERSPERKIYQVLDLIRKWRELYNGCIDINTGKSLRLNLNEAAGRIGVSRKSMDDYSIVVKRGEMLGFDFETNSDMGFGLLRNFVKAHQGSNKKLKKFNIKTNKDQESWDTQIHFQLKKYKKEDLGEELFL